MAILKTKGVPTRNVEAYPQSKRDEDRRNMLIDNKIKDWKSRQGGWNSVPTTKDEGMLRDLAAKDVEYDLKPTKEKVKDFAINAGMSLLPELGIGRNAVGLLKRVPGITSDAPELGFHALNRNHWALHPGKIDASAKQKVALYAQAALNRTLPILNKTPLIHPIRKQAERYMLESGGSPIRTISSLKNALHADEGAAGVYEALSLPKAHYTGANWVEELGVDIPDKRNLIKQYLYGKGEGFVDAGKDMKLLNFGDRYEKELYPEAKKLIMNSKVKNGDAVPVRDELRKKLRLSDNVGSNQYDSPVKPVDDLGAGHQLGIARGGDKETLITQDLWKFNPKDYSTQYGKGDLFRELQAEKQAGMLDKVGKPFYLVQNNPIIRKPGVKQVFRLNEDILPDPPKYIEIK